MESISRISGMLETARDLTLEAARDAGASRRSIKQMPSAQIKKLLDSRNERDVLEGLRRVIEMQYTAPLSQTLPFFPSVLKTLSHPTSSTRPLVYSYLLHHAEADPDTALLSINTIQKSLSDTSPRVRAMALKTMSGVRIPLISQIVSLAIKKGTADMSPIVRKAAAFACVKCVKLDPSTLPQVTDYLSTLLGDKQYFVAGAAVAAFSQVCPERLDLIHPHYRSLVKKLVDMDEWGQISTLQLMTVYARKSFPRRTRRLRKANTQVEKQKGFYDDDDADEQEVEYEDVEVLDPDLDLLLTSALPLLQSRTSAVVIAVTRAYLYLAPAQYLHHAIGPLTALLRGPPDINQIGLHNIVQICLLYPQHFVPHFRHFLLRSGEGEQTWRLKLEVLTLVFPHCATDVQGLILTELEHFSQGHDPALVRESVRAIGRCAHNSDATTGSRCLRLLLRQIHSPDQHLVAEALEVIRHMIQRDPLSHTKTVIRLAKNLDTLTSPAARASIIWLVGEFAGYSTDQSIAPDVLRILVRGYPDEHDLVRQQIVLLAAKVYLHWLNAENASKKKDGPPILERQSSSTVLAPDEHEDGAGFRDEGFENENTSNFDSQEDKSHPISLLYHHTLLLARYTPSYDLRDRARMFRALLAVPSSTELASLLLLAPKPVPQAPSPSESRKGYVLGSASLVIGEESGVGGLSGYEPLPDWVQEGEEPDAKLRNDDTEAKTEYRVGGSTNAPASRMLDDALKGSAPVSYKPKSGAPAKEKTLDDWLDEEDDESEEETDESEGEEEETDEDEEETDEEDDDEEDSSGEEDESDSDDGNEKRRLVG
ncbi:ARM repeat-containing protein [Aureobasidium pullulans]|nr:ARM repeat-containing protein [Aureobasidium pullulans]